MVLVLVSVLYRLYRTVYQITVQYGCMQPGCTRCRTVAAVHRRHRRHRARRENGGRLTPGIEPLPFRPRDRLLNRRSEATGDAGVCGFAGIYTRDSSQETAAAETAAAETAVTETAVTETASEAPHVLARWLCCRIAG